MKKSLKIAVAALSLSATMAPLSNLKIEAVEAPAFVLNAASWRKRSMEDIQASVNEIVATGNQTYVIQWGDTLGTIAAVTGISVNDLAAINQISNPDLIIAGSVIYFDAVNHTLTYTEPSGEEVTVAAEETVVSDIIEESNHVEDGYLFETIEEWDLEEDATELVVDEATESTEEEAARLAAEEAAQLTEEEAARLSEEEAARLAEEEAAQLAEEEAANSTDPTVYGRPIVVEATAYSRNEAGLGNFTADGTDLTVESAVIAVDPSVIPLGTTVYIPGWGYYRAADTGGAIVGNKIDVHFENVADTYQFGRQSLTIYIVD